MTEKVYYLRSIPKQLPLPIRMGYGWLRRKFVPHEIWDNKEFKSFYQWLQETQWWSRNQLEAMQLKSLKDLIKHAYEHVPYYRRVFDEIHLKPKDISTLDDLQKVPILTKEKVRKNIQDLIARNIDPGRLRYSTTGGSTGKPLGFYQDECTADQHEFAFIFRQWNWAGYRLGDKIVTVRGNVIARSDRDEKRAWWDYNTDNNELVLSSMAMNEENMRKYIDKIREFNPRFINAYPSSLEILARFMKRNGIVGIKANAAFLESETIYPWQRALIEEQFGCKVFGGYGLTEHAADAVECERHNGYHINMEYGILELIDNEDKIIDQPGVTGRVVGTGFDTYCMPFIRYATDDLAEYARGKCSCKRRSVLIQNFKGRVQEFVVSKSGTIISLTSFYSAAHIDVLSKIIELKFIQKKEGELIVEIVKLPSASEKEITNEFVRNLNDRLGKDGFNIRVKYVFNISRTERGKIGLLEQKLPISVQDINLSNN